MAGTILRFEDVSGSMAIDVLLPFCFPHIPTFRHRPKRKAQKSKKTRHKGKSRNGSILRDEKKRGKGQQEIQDLRGESFRTPVSHILENRKNKDDAERSLVVRDRRP